MEGAEPMVVPINAALLAVPESHEAAAGYGGRFLPGATGSGRPAA